MLEIMESETNRFFRRSILLFADLAIITGSAFLIALMFLYKNGLLAYGDLLSMLICFGFIIFGLYLRRRVVRITAIGSDHIEFATMKKKLLLKSDSIVSMTKLVRFTVSERIWLIITCINKKGCKERWLFQTEPKMDIVNEFKRMKIKLKNFP